MQHVPPKYYTIRPGQGRLYIEIYWSKLIHVGFIEVMLAVQSPNNIHERQYGEECVIDGRRIIYHNVDG